MRPALPGAVIHEGAVYSHLILTCLFLRFSVVGRALAFSRYERGKGGSPYAATRGATARFSSPAVVYPCLGRKNRTRGHTRRDRGVSVLAHCAVAKDERGPGQRPGKQAGGVKPHALLASLGSVKGGMIAPGGASNGGGFRMSFGCGQGHFRRAAGF